MSNCQVVIQAVVLILMSFVLVQPTCKIVAKKFSVHSVVRFMRTITLAYVISCSFSSTMSRLSYQKLYAIGESAPSIIQNLII